MSPCRPSPAPSADADAMQAAREVIAEWQRITSPEGWIDEEMHTLRTCIAAALTAARSEGEARGKLVWDHLTQELRLEMDAALEQAHAKGRAEGERAAERRAYERAAQLADRIREEIRSELLASHISITFMNARVRTAERISSAIRACALAETPETTDERER